jgi:hypothetical protein
MVENPSSGVSSRPGAAGEIMMAQQRGPSIFRTLEQPIDCPARLASEVSEIAHSALAPASPIQENLNHDDVP